MSKLFIVLHTGRNSIDNSMGYNTYRFTKEDHPVLVRPHLIETMQRKRWGNGLDFTYVTLTGQEGAICVAESPEQIEAMIEAIECQSKK